MEVNNNSSLNASVASYSAASNSKKVEISEKVSGNASQREITIKSESQEFSLKVFDYQAAAMEQFFGGGSAEAGAKSPLDVTREDMQAFLSDIGYEGKPIAELSKEEAAELVSEDGFFGVKKTAERIANFVLNGAGDDEKLLREGRKGILQGFDQAKQISGGKLPDISYETIDKAVEMIDKRMNELGYAILDEEV